MRDVAHSAASPDQAPYAVAEAVFADAKAYLSSREAQQMSESELERELHRRGQELMRRLLQGHLDQRTPGEAAGPVEGVDDVERSQRRLQEHHPETTFGTVQVARGRSRVDGAETQLNRASAAVDLTVWIDLIHVAEYVCKAVPVFHRHRRHRRGVRYLVRDRDGVHWCTLVLPSTAVSSMRGPGSAGWHWVGAEAVLKLRVLRPAATSMRTGTHDAGVPAAPRAAIR